jgi:hypothetical protein
MILAASLLAGGSGLAQGDIVDRQERMFEVAARGAIKIEVDRGPLEITTGESSRVRIEIIRTVNTSDESKARALFASHQITMTQEGNRIVLLAKAPRETAISWFSWFSRRPVLRARYLVTLPKEFNVDAQTAGGSISVADLKGELKATTAGGSMRVELVEGPVDLRTAGGSIRLKGSTGHTHLETAGGSIQAGAIRGKLDANTAGGSIHVDQVMGPARLNTAGGSITVGEAQDTTVASTSGGSISIGLSRSPPDGVRLSTSGGSIRARIAPDLKANLDAQAAGGRVVIDQPITVEGEIKPSRIKGRINGGGPLFELRTSGGSIRLQKLATASAVQVEK